MVTRTDDINLIYSSLLTLKALIASALRPASVVISLYWRVTNPKMVKRLLAAIRLQSLLEPSERVHHQNYNVNDNISRSTCVAKILERVSPTHHNLSSRFEEWEPAHLSFPIKFYPDTLILSLFEEDYHGYHSLWLEPDPTLSSPVSAVFMAS